MNNNGFMIERAKFLCFSSHGIESSGTNDLFLNTEESYIYPEQLNIQLNFTKMEINGGFLIKIFQSTNSHVFYGLLFEHIDDTYSILLVNNDNKEGRWDNLKLPGKLNIESRSVETHQIYLKLDEDSISLFFNDKHICDIDWGYKRIKNDKTKFGFSLFGGSYNISKFKIYSTEETMFEFPNDEQTDETILFPKYSILALTKNPDKNKIFKLSENPIIKKILMFSNPIEELISDSKLTGCKYIFLNKKSQQFNIYNSDIIVIMKDLEEIDKKMELIYNFDIENQSKYIDFINGLSLKKVYREDGLIFLTKPNFEQIYKIDLDFKQLLNLIEE